MSRTPGEELEETHKQANEAHDNGDAFVVFDPDMLVALVHVMDQEEAE